MGILPSKPHQRLFDPFCSQPCFEEDNDMEIQNKRDGHNQLPTGTLMLGLQIGTIPGLEAAR